MEKLRSIRSRASTEHSASRIRRIIGDILLASVAMLTADVVIVTLRKIDAIVLKANYQKIFIVELILLRDPSVVRAGRPLRPVHPVEA